MTPLVTLVERFPNIHAFVAGDAMIDRYHFGHVDRLSPEAPVPIFIADSSEDRAGGAANVAKNLSGLRCRTWASFPRKLSLKTRYIVGHHAAFRVDDDAFSSPATVDIDWAVENLSTGDFHVLVLSDYAKGWLSPTMCRRLIETARTLEIPVVVDPKGNDWLKYEGATVICPNEIEFGNIDHAKTPRDVLYAVKRGPHGIDVLVPDGPGCTFPAQARHVYDVTGAGDTVVATIAAALAVGGTIGEAVRLAVLTSGYVVGEVGTSVCSWDTLCDLLGRQSSDEKDSRALRSV